MNVSRSVTPARWSIVAVVLVLLVAGLACQSKQEGNTEVPIRDINAVMEAHAGELMAIPGVVGVAIGETEDKTPCILVLVKEETDQIKKAVPPKLEGHSTRLLVTGEIKPMGGN
jgi:hypothetical protein